MPKGVLPDNPEMSSRARELRKRATKAEDAMWVLLRHRRLRGLKFRRQFPIDNFVADFCCYGIHLIVELDGDVHQESSQLSHDENRDIHLHSRGYKVLRIPNHRVFDHPEAVVQEIFQAALERGWQPVDS